MWKAVICGSGASQRTMISMPAGDWNGSATSPGWVLARASWNCGERSRHFHLAEIHIDAAVDLLGQLVEMIAAVDMLADDIGRLHRAGEQILVGLVADGKQHARQRQRAVGIDRGCGFGNLWCPPLPAARARTECNSRPDREWDRSRLPGFMVRNTSFSAFGICPSAIQPRSPPCAAVGFWLNWRATVWNGAPS